MSMFDMMGGEDGTKTSLLSSLSLVSIGSPIMYYPTFQNIEINGLCGPFSPYAYKYMRFA